MAPIASRNESMAERSASVGTVRDYHRGFLGAVKTVLRWGGGLTIAHIPVRGLAACLGVGCEGFLLRMT